MLPISLRPNGRRAVIVGGGEIAARKAESLINAGFPIFVVADRIEDRLRLLLAEHGAAYAQRAYVRTDLEKAALAIAATDDEELNGRVVADARNAGVLVCDASRGERGDFTTPATLRIGDITIGVDSGGNAPSFSKRIARDIAQHVGPQYAAAMQTVARMRSYVKRSFPINERAGILRALSDRPVDELAAMSGNTLICATRESALAMTQSRMIAATLASHGIATGFLGITTHGDRNRDRSIDRLDAVNVFVKELELALRDRRADYAVHSCKDLPSELPADMRIAAFSHREDARDAFCSERYASFDALPRGSLVGTSSPRRRAQLAALRSDLRYEPLRGNVDTRLGKLRDGQYDAIVLAMAGLRRLKSEARHVVPFSHEEIVPAVGQGSLAVEVRTDDVALAHRLYEAINDGEAELCIECERAALRELRAGCSAPIGVHAVRKGNAITARIAYALENGRINRETLTRNVNTVDEARALGTQLAGALESVRT
jgi:hydroxymethylbilane synthase